MFKQIVIMFSIHIYCILEYMIEIYRWSPHDGMHGDITCGMWTKTMYDGKCSGPNVSM